MDTPEDSNDRIGKCNIENILFLTYLRTMDSITLGHIAAFICGNGNDYPSYRSGYELTQFFERIGLCGVKHDGSKRYNWTFEQLKNLQYVADGFIINIILRLANPKEYGGDSEKVNKAINKLNQILMVEGLKVELDGITPKIIDIEPSISQMSIDENAFKKLPIPDFQKYCLDPILASVMNYRWEEIQKCLNSECFLSAIILMGSILEALLLSVFDRYQKDANQSPLTPKDQKSGKPKLFREWTLAEMINVAHNLNWINKDVKDFSHALREFRNLIHPYEQMKMDFFPDKDTCNISWQVVQAAINDLSKKLIIDEKNNPK